MVSNPDASSSKSNVVLVADDDFFMRSQVQLALGDIATIIEVESGDQVLESYKKTPPAVLLLDIHMPKRSGKDILKDILDYDPTAYVLMLSADSNEKNVRDSFGEGAKGFITKPFSKQTLFKYVMPALSFSDGSTSFM